MLRAKRGFPMKNLAIVFAILSLSMAPLYAQTVGATLEGTVSDSTGAVLPGAEYKRNNTGAGITNDPLSDARGRFRVPLLRSGEYEVQVTMVGFTTAVRRGIRLTVGQTAVVDLTLQVGAVSQDVSVTADAN